MTPLLLSTRVEAAAAGSGTITFVGATEPETVSWRELHDDARAVAAALAARGVMPGDRVCLLGPTTRDLVTAIQAIWLAGAATVILPLPMRLGSVDEFVAQTRTRITNADARLVLLDGDLAAFVDPHPSDPPFVLLRDIRGAAKAEAYEAPHIDPDTLAILQFTSGSTSDPKGVMLPHAQVAANLDAIAIAAELDVDTDVLVSWLPLYHDMGLIGLMSLSMTTGTDLVLAGPQDFMAAPGRWMDWMSTYRGTATAGPNFSYALSARALRQASNLDLSRWRIALNGAEPIDPDSVEAFVAAGAAHKLDPRAVFCAFGMAEATLAVTFPKPFTGMATDCVDLASLEGERYAAPAEPGSPTSRRLAKLGTAVPGLEIRIVDADTGNKELGEREVGELLVKGTSVTTGYFRRPDLNGEMFADGWLRTGDLAYQVDGELVVCGRIKDVIIVGGRNLFPEDVERAVGDVEGVRPGNVIAFGVHGRKGREALVVVAEAKGADHDGMRRAVADRIRDSIGMGPEEVVLVLPGTLPKTSSGKLQRSLCKSRYLDEELVTA